MRIISNIEAAAAVCLDDAGRFRERGQPDAARAMREMALQHSLQAIDYVRSSDRGSSYYPDMHLSAASIALELGYGVCVRQLSLKALSLSVEPTTEERAQHLLRWSGERLAQSRDTPGTADGAKRRDWLVASLYPSPSSLSAGQMMLDLQRALTIAWMLMNCQPGPLPPKDGDGGVGSNIWVARGESLCRADTPSRLLAAIDAVAASPDAGVAAARFVTSGAEGTLWAAFDCDQQAASLFMTYLQLLGAAPPI